MRSAKLLSMFLALAFLAAPSPIRAQDAARVPPGVKIISPAQLEQMLKAKDFFLVNVHVPYAGEIPQTDSFIPYDETESRRAQYPADKAAKIVVYCRTNRMAGIALQRLVNLGFTNLYLLDGGMTAWKQAGLTLLNRDTAPGVPYPGAAGKSPTGPLPQGCPCAAQ